MAVIPVDDEEFSVETRNVSPAHFLLKIESFPFLSKSGIQKFESNEFSAGDYKWKLVIYPDGLDNENETDHISVYLAAAGISSLPDDWEVHAMFSIFLYNQIMDNYLCFRGKERRFNAMKSIWGSSNLISKKTLAEPVNGFLVDDNCVFGAEVFVIKNQRTVQWFFAPKTHSWMIPNFSKSNDFCGSEEFTAGGCKWRVNLYPNGYRNSKGKHVSIYLYCADFSSNKKVDADFSICIKNQLDGIHLSSHSSHCFELSKRDWGWASFTSIETMLNPSEGLLVDDCCIIESEVTVRAIA